MAGTTLVGQAIGARTLDWAAKVGNGIIVIAVTYMGLSGLVIAAAGPWIMPFFTNPAIHNPRRLRPAAASCCGSLQAISCSTG